MIKLALKHFILETCINVIFDPIKSSFSTNKRFKVGQRFDVLIEYEHHRDLYFEYHDVIIKEINNSIWNFESIFITYQYKYIGFDIYNTDFSDDSAVYKEIVHNGKVYYCTYYKPEPLREYQTLTINTKYLIL
jgi:hypothetical protein